MCSSRLHSAARRDRVHAQRACMLSPDASATAIERKAGPIDPSLSKVADVTCRLTAWFRHPKPNDKDQAQRYTGNADEPNRASKVSRDEAEDCRAERCADARERPNEALRQIESASAFGEISNN